MMRKLILTLLLLLLPAVCWSDEYYDFVKITCAKEVGFLEIQPTGMSNIGGFVKRDFSLNINNLKNLEKKYSLYLLWPGDTIKQKCELKEKTVRIEIRRDESRAHGQCAANPLSYISLWIDNEKIVSSVKFGDITSCFPPYIKKITLQDSAGDFSLLLLIEGTDAYSIEHYIAPWERRQMNKSITDDYVEAIMQKKTEKLENSIKNKIKKQGGR